MIGENQYLNSIIDLLEKLGYAVKKTPNKSQQIVSDEVIDERTYNNWRNRSYTDIDEEIMSVKNQLSVEQNRIRNYKQQFLKIYSQFNSENKPKFVDVIIENEKVNELREQLMALERVVRRKIRRELERKFDNTLEKDKKATYQEIQTDIGHKFKIRVEDDVKERREYEFETEKNIQKPDSLPNLKEELKKELRKEIEEEERNKIKKSTITPEQTVEKVPEKPETKNEEVDKPKISLRIGGGVKEVTRANPEDPNVEVDTLAELTDDDVKGIFKN